MDHLRHRPHPGGSQQIEHFLSGQHGDQNDNRKQPNARHGGICVEPAQPDQRGNDQRSQKQSPAEHEQGFLLVRR